MMSYDQLISQQEPECAFPESLQKQILQNIRKSPQRRAVSPSKLNVAQLAECASYRPDLAFKRQNQSPSRTFFRPAGDTQTKKQHSYDPAPNHYSPSYEAIEQHPTMCNLPKTQRVLFTDEFNKDDGLGPGYYNLQKQRRQDLGPSRLPGFTLGGRVQAKRPVCVDLMYNTDNGQKYLLNKTRDISFQKNGFRFKEDESRLLTFKPTIKK